MEVINRRYEDFFFLFLLLPELGSRIDAATVVFFKYFFH